MAFPSLSVREANIALCSSLGRDRNFMTIDQRNIKTKNKEECDNEIHFVHLHDLFLLKKERKNNQ